MSYRKAWSLVAVIALAVGVVVWPAAAGDGEPLVMGEKNAAKTVTRLNTRGGLRVDNFRNGNPALILNVADPGVTPPLQVNSDAVVPNLNADLLDGKDAGDFAPLASPVVIGAAALHGTGTADEWRFSYDYVQTGNDDAIGSVFGQMVAAVDLPNGASVTGLAARVTDGSSTARVSVALLRAKRDESFPEELDGLVCRTVLAAESSLAATPGTTTITDGVVEEGCIDDPVGSFYPTSDWSLVDNSVWTYYLLVEVERTGGLDQDARFLSAAVSFTGP